MPVYLGTSPGPRLAYRTMPHTTHVHTHTGRMDHQHSTPTFPVSVLYSLPCPLYSLDMETSDLRHLQAPVMAIYASPLCTSKHHCCSWANQLSPTRRSAIPSSLASVCLCLYVIVYKHSGKYVKPTRLSDVAEIPTLGPRTSYIIALPTFGLAPVVKEGPTARLPNDERDPIVSPCHDGRQQGDAQDFLQIYHHQAPGSSPLWERTTRFWFSRTASSFLVR